MSNTWLNLRLGGRFLQWQIGKWLPTFRRVPNRPTPNEPWAELYELRMPL